MVPTLIYAYATLFLVSLQLPCYRCQIMYVLMYVTISPHKLPNASFRQI